MTEFDYKIAKDYAELVAKYEILKAEHEIMLEQHILLNKNDFHSIKENHTLVTKEGSKKIYHKFGEK